MRICPAASATRAPYHLWVGRRLWDKLRVVAEPGGACALAALTSGAWRPTRRERVAVIVCGGNTAPGDLS